MGLELFRAKCSDLRDKGKVGQEFRESGEIRVIKVCPVVRAKIGIV